MLYEWYGVASNEKSTTFLYIKYFFVSNELAYEYFENFLVTKRLGFMVQAILRHSKKARKEHVAFPVVGVTGLPHKYPL